MIEVKLQIDNIDYDAIAELLVPLLAEQLEGKGGLLGKLAGSQKQLATKMARKVLGTMSQEKKDELVVELLTRKQELLMDKGEELLKKRGIGVRIRDVSVRKY